jgi:hypothetical protein
MIKYLVNLRRDFTMDKLKEMVIKVIGIWVNVEFFFMDIVIDIFGIPQCDTWKEVFSWIKYKREHGR